MNLFSLRPTTLNTCVKHLLSTWLRSLQCKCVVRYIVGRWFTFRSWQTYFVFQLFWLIQLSLQLLHLHVYGYPVYFAGTAKQVQFSIFRVLFTAQCTLVQMRGLGIACRLSVCPSVTLVDCDHIGWKSWKLIARTISPTPSLFVAKRRSTYS